MTAESVLHEVGPVAFARVAVLLPTTGRAADAPADDKDDPMTLAIEWVLIDCVDLNVMTEFWCKALDLEHVGNGPSGGHILMAADRSGRRLGLLPSGTTKVDKNRVHFDLRPDDELRRCCGWRASVPGVST